MGNRFTEMLDDIDFIKRNMIVGHQLEIKMLLESKLGTTEATELFADKYDAKTAEVLESSIFEQQMQMGNLETSLVSPIFSLLSYRV
jgi:hypothetical protein